MTDYTVEELESHRKDFIAALRSGNFKQGHFNLKTYNGYCCLGVACEIAGVPAIRDGTGVYHFLDHKAALPEEVRKYYGFRSGLGFIADGSKYGTLSAMNDIVRLNFKEIADFAEENWDKVFTND